jgi:hypothetical protein
MAGKAAGIADLLPFGVTLNLFQGPASRIGAVIQLDPGSSPG